MASITFHAKGRSMTRKIEDVSPTSPAITVNAAMGPEVALRSMNPSMKKVIEIIIIDAHSRVSDI
jgi:hypothetical protein